MEKIDCFACTIHLPSYDPKTVVLCLFGTKQHAIWIDRVLPKLVSVWFRAHTLILLPPLAQMCSNNLNCSVEKTKFIQTNMDISIRVFPQHEILSLKILAWTKFRILTQIVLNCLYNIGIPIYIERGSARRRLILNNSSDQIGLFVVIRFFFQKNKNWSIVGFFKFFVKWGSSKKHPEAMSNWDLCRNFEYMYYYLSFEKFYNVIINQI